MEIGFRGYTTWSKILALFAQSWRFFVWITIFSISIDYVLIPKLIEHDYSKLSTFLITAPLATFGVVYDYYFWRWVRKSKWVKEVLDARYKFSDILVKNGWWELTKHAGFCVVSDFAKEHKRLSDQIVESKSRIIKVINYGGRALSYVAIFLIGLEPLIPGCRLIAAFVCGVRRWLSGLCVLLAANLLHVWIMVWVISFLPKSFIHWWYYGYLLLFTFLFIRHIYSKIKKEL